MPMVEEKSTQLIDIASIWLSIIIIWSESYVWPFEKVYKFLKKNKNSTRGCCYDGTFKRTFEGTKIVLSF